MKWSNIILSVCHGMFTDRPGFFIAGSVGVDGVSSEADCKDMCAATPKCAGISYGANLNPMCQLAESTATISPNSGVNSYLISSRNENCVESMFSGSMPGRHHFRYALFIVGRLSFTFHVFSEDLYIMLADLASVTSMQFEPLPCSISQKKITFAYALKQKCITFASTHVQVHCKCTCKKAMIPYLSILW